MKTLLGMETLEPRTLLAGLIGIPTTTVLQLPVESTPAPAAEIGPMRAAADEAPPATIGPLLEADFSAAPEAVLPGRAPEGNWPQATDNSDVEHPKPTSGLNPSVEAEKSDLQADSQPAEPPKRESPEPSSDTDTSSNAPPKAMAPVSTEDSDLKPDSASTPAPPTVWPARADSPIAPPLLSLLATSLPASQVEETLASASFRTSTSTSEASAAFRYFEPLGPSYQDGDGLHSEPLADDAVRETFIAFLLLTKQDQGDSTSPHGAVIPATATAKASPQAPAAHPREEHSLTETDSAQQTELVDRALAAISNADEILREAGAVCAVAHSRPTVASNGVQAFAAAAKSSQPASKQASAGQACTPRPCTPSWQVGMCSLVAMLFSFRAPAESSQGSSTVRTKLRRAGA